MAFSVVCRNMSFGSFGFLPPFLGGVSTRAPVRISAFYPMPLPYKCHDQKTTERRKRIIAGGSRNCSGDHHVAAEEGTEQEHDLRIFWGPAGQLQKRKVRSTR